GRNSALLQAVITMRGLIGLLLGVGLLSAAPAFAAGNYIGYVGTYTDDKAKGVYSLKWDAAAKTVVSLGLQAGGARPSFVPVSPSHKFLYAITERAARRDGTGSVSSYAIDPATGALKLINRVPAHGNTSAHLVVDASGKWLLVANYGSGSVASFALHADGSIGEMATFKTILVLRGNPPRPEGPPPQRRGDAPPHPLPATPGSGAEKGFPPPPGRRRRQAAPAKPRRHQAGLRPPPHGVRKKRQVRLC